MEVQELGVSRLGGKVGGENGMLEVIKSVVIPGVHITVCMSQEVGEEGEIPGAKKVKSN